MSTLCNVPTVKDTGTDTAPTARAKQINQPVAYAQRATLPPNAPWRMKRQTQTATTEDAQTATQPATAPLKEADVTATHTTNSYFSPGSTSQMTSGDKQLKCLQINLRHCAAEAANLSQIIHELQPDLIFIQEPYVKPTGDLADVPLGYQSYHRLGEDRNYGAAIIYRANISVKPITEKSSNEIACIELECYETKIMCCSAYCRPSAANLHEILNPILQSSRATLKKCLIAADANAHSPLWNSKTTDAKGKELENILITHELNICNKPRAHLSYTPANTTFIDVTITGDELFQKVVDWRFLSKSAFTDHEYIYFKMDLSPKKRRLARYLPKPNYVNIPLARNLLSCSLRPPHELNTREEINTAINLLTGKISQAIRDAAIPRPRNMVYKTKWWNKELYRLRHKLWKARKKQQQTGYDAGNDVSRLKSEYQSALRKAKFEDAKNFCTNELDEDPFGSVKKALRKNKPFRYIQELRNREGVVRTSESEILATLAEAFFPKGPTVSDTMEDYATTVAERILTDPAQQAEVIPDLTYEELSRAVFSMKKNKAAGKDQIAADYIQHFYPEIKNHLHSILSASLKRAYFPEQWKEAEMLVIPKPDKPDYLAPSAYRPMLSAMGKVYEKILLARLEYEAASNHWLTETQHGFRPGKSTVTAIDSLTQQIEHGFSLRARTTCVLLDIQGAFDNCCPQAIIRNLNKKRCPHFSSHPHGPQLPKRTNSKPAPQKQNAKYSAVQRLPARKLPLTVPLQHSTR
jgi:Endonuclease-reverse transcriptase/Reverse transcriptase (RNA-dependent DNA polymerase)